MTEYFATGGDLYQWDIGRKVTIALPEGETASVVEFTINNETNALVVDVNGNEAAIPNILLQTAGGLRMWAVTVTADGRQTRRYGSAPVYSRAKPDDYIYTETEVKRYEDFEERIKALEKNGGGAVESVNGQTGAVKLTAADVGAIPAEKTGTIKSTGVLIAGDGQPHYARMEGGDGRAMFSMRDASGNIINRVSLRESETTLGQPLAISSGGHGGKNAAEGRQNLSLYSKEEIDEKITNTQKEIERLTEEIDALKGSGTVTETVTKTGKFLSIEANAGTEITVNADDTGTVTLVHCGKNLMPPMQTETVTVGGVTLALNADNTISITGEATSTQWPDYIKAATPVHIPAGEYVLRANGVDENVSFAMMLVDRTKEYVCGKKNDGSISSMVQITLDEGKDVFFYFTIRTGVYAEKIISVQLERGNAVTDYTPCSMVEYAESTLPKTLIANAGMNYIYTKTEDVLTASYGIEKNAPTNGASNFDAKQYGLPVLTLNGNCTGMTKDDYVSLAYTFQDKDGNALSGNVDVKKQGSSSIQTGIEIGAAFDTDLGGLFNFTLKFPEAFEAKEGWGTQKKYVFKANAIDHSHARNLMSCKLWGEIVKSRANVPSELSSLPNGGAVDGFPVVIILNGKFYALGTFNIPKDGWMFGAPKAILCADQHTDATKFKALATLNGDFKLEYVENEDDSGWVLTSINRAIQAVMDGNLDTVGQYIDIPSAIDYYIHAVYEQATDGTDKNYILVTFDGVKWYFSNYDRDTVYGLWWNGKKFITPDSEVTYAAYASAHSLMNLIYTQKKAELKARSVELRNSVLSEANVTTVFTNFTAEIPAELFAQNCRRWPLLRSTSVSNVMQIINWYRLRRAYIDPLTDALS